MRSLFRLTLIVYGLGLMLVAGWQWVKATDGEVLAWVIFTSSHNGNLEIYTMRRDSSRLQNLTKSDGDDFLVDIGFLPAIFAQCPTRMIFGIMLLFTAY
jgi:hypothetical protein